MTELFSVSLADMIAEVRRECTTRRRVYDRLVAEKKMNRRLADRRIDVMDALLVRLLDEQLQEEPPP